MRLEPDGGVTVITRSTARRAMSRGGWLRSSLAARVWLLLTTVASVRGVAQHAGAGPLLQRVSWPLLDFVVLSDSIHGVELIASPNLRSVQGRGRRGDKASLVLEPVATRHWATAVALLVDSVSRQRREDRRPFLTVPLLGNRGRARLTVAFDGKGSSDAPFALGIVDSLSQHAWTTDASAGSIRDLLTALDETAQGSRLDTVPRPRDRGVAYLEGEVDERPRQTADYGLEYPPSAFRQWREGRVLAEWVVDTSGRVRAETVRALWSDGDDFSAAVKQALLHARFVPAMVRGVAVEVLLREWFVFRLER